MILRNNWSTEESHLDVWWLWKGASNNPEPHPSWHSVSCQYFRLCVLSQLFVVALSFELWSQILIGKEMSLCRSRGRSVSHLLWSFLLDLSKVFLLMSLSPASYSTPMGILWETSQQLWFLACFQGQKTGERLSGASAGHRHRKGAGKRPSWNAKLVGWGCGGEGGALTWPSHGASSEQPQWRGTL